MSELCFISGISLKTNLFISLNPTAVEHAASLLKSVYFEAALIAAYRDLKKPRSPSLGGRFSFTIG